jgi:hypothetical protein
VASPARHCRVRRPGGIAAPLTAALDGPRPWSVGPSVRHTKLRVDSPRACRAADRCRTCGAARASGGRAGAGTATAVVAGAHVRRDGRCCRPRAAGRRARPRGDDGLRARPGHLAGGGGTGPADPARPGPYRDRRRGLRRLPTMRAADRLASPTGPARDHILRALRRVALTGSGRGESTGWRPARSAPRLGPRSPERWPRPRPCRHPSGYRTFPAPSGGGGGRLR